MIKTHLIIISTLALTQGCAIKSVNGEALPVSREDVRLAIRNENKKISLCYEKLLDSDSKAHGKVVLEFNILKSKYYPVRSDMTAFISKVSDTSFLDCLNLTLSQAKWPQLDQAFSVSYPFVFAPSEN